MPSQITQQIDLDQLKAADDATFWELAARYGYDRSAGIDPDQAWFWTREWITGEIEADINSAEGRGTIYYSDEEFLAALRARINDADPQ